MAQYIKCCNCKKRAKFATTQPMPGGEKRVHRQGFGCRKATPEQEAASLEREIQKLEEAGWRDRRAELAAQVPVLYGTKQGDTRCSGRLGSMASALAAAFVIRPAAVRTAQAQ